MAFVDDLMLALPDTRESFYKRGLSLPNQYLLAVEGMRKRASSEHSYQFFLDEVTREATALNVPWQPSARHMLGCSERSVYLDHLAQRSSERSLSIDPNFELFVQPTESSNFQLLQFREQKRRESEAFEDLFTESVLVAKKSIIQALLLVAKNLSFITNENVSARSESITLVRTPGTLTSAASLCIVDIRALLKQGDVLVQYSFDALPGKRFTLGRFVPGGHLYCQWNKSHEAILFSFYVQAIFLLDLTDRMRRTG